ncbi:MAG: hydantoinase B/oxoprolinase family protein [Gemmobacter sp.]|nr:hydantoinase B/oxoprolinase family protein [Gemmobacter sp.]
MRQFDPIRLEVMKNAFDAIADEMALMLMRAAYSPIVRDSMDYSTAICDAQGQTLAQGVTTPMHLGSFYDAMQHLMRRYARATSAPAMCSSAMIPMPPMASTCPISIS